MYRIDHIAILLQPVYSLNNIAGNIGLSLFFRIAGMLQSSIDANKTEIRPNLYYS